MYSGDLYYNVSTHTVQWNRPIFSMGNVIMKADHDAVSELEDDPTTWRRVPIQVEGEDTYFFFNVLTQRSTWLEPSFIIGEPSEDNIQRQSLINYDSGKSGFKNAHASTADWNRTTHFADPMQNINHWRVYSFLIIKIFIKYS